MPRKVEPEDILRERREALGLTQEELATLANMSRGTVRNAEAGKTLAERSRRALEDVLAIRLGDVWGGDAEEILPLDVARPLLQALARLFTNEDVALSRSTATAYSAVVARLAVGRDLEIDTLAKLLDPLMRQMPPAGIARVAEHLREFVPPDEQSKMTPSMVAPSLIDPVQPSLHRSGSTQMSVTGGAAGRANLPAGGLAGLSGPPEDAVLEAAMSPEEELADEFVSQVGDSYVSLRWLGTEVNLGLIQVRVNVPITAIPVRLLTRDDLRVIADTVEAQVAQMAKSLAWSRGWSEKQRPTRTRVENQIRELEDEIKVGRERQLRLVASLQAAGIDVDVIAKSIGETKKDVEQMLQQANSLFGEAGDGTTGEPDSESQR